MPVGVSRGPSTWSPPPAWGWLGAFLSPGENTVGFVGDPRRGLLCAPKPSFPQRRPTSQGASLKQTGLCPPPQRLPAPRALGGSERRQPAYQKVGGTVRTWVQRKCWDAHRRWVLGPGVSSSGVQTWNPIPTCRHVLHPRRDETQGPSSKYHIWLYLLSVWWGDLFFPPRR